MTSKFFVYVIESPSAEDFLNEIKEGTALMETLKQAHIPVIYKVAVNKEMFNKALQQEEFAKVTKEISHQYGQPVVPFLHLSTHGDKKGIQLTSGEQISWGELRLLLSPINKSLEESLVICISSCESFASIEMALGGALTPFLAIVVNEGRPKWDETLTAFITFYHLMAKSFEGEKVPTVLDAMKMASGNNQFKILTRKEAEKERSSLILKNLAKILARSSETGTTFRKF